MAPRTLRVVAPAVEPRTSPAFDRYQAARAGLARAREQQERARQVLRGYQADEQRALAEQDEASAALGEAVAAEMLGNADAKAAAEKRCREAALASDRAERIVETARATMRALDEAVSKAETEQHRALAAFLPEVEAVLAPELRAAIDHAYALAARRVAIHEALGSSLTGEPARLGDDGVIAIARKHGMKENLYPSAVPPFAGDIVATVTEILGLAPPPAPEAA